MTGLDRRGFVKLGASSAFLLGLPLGAQAKELQMAGPAAARVPAGATLDWVQFRAEMKKRNQPGVIILLQPLGQPAAQDKAAPREALQRRLVADTHGVNPLAAAVHSSLFSCGDSELPLLLVQAVFVAAPAEQARKEFPLLPANAGLALVTADGKVVRSLPADAELAVKFTTRAVELMYDKDGARLAELVKTERAALGETVCKQIDAAVVDLDDDSFDRRQAASETLNGLFGKAPAVLTQARRAAPSLEVRSRVDTLFRKKLNEENSAALLQRSLAPHVAVADFNLRIKCGQGALLPQAHTFVQLWCEAVQV